MNVMRPHPTRNRGKGKIFRKTHGESNIFQTVRAGTNTFRRTARGGSSSSFQAIGSSSLSRLQWSNHRSATLSSSDAPDVARILTSDTSDCRWTSGVDTGRISSTAHEEFIGDPVNDPGRDQFFPASEGADDSRRYSEGFFDNILDNPNWTGGGQCDNVPPINMDVEATAADPFLLPNQGPTNQEEGAFFTLEHVLQNDTGSLSVAQGSSSAQPPPSSEDCNCFFKAPLPLSKDHSGSRPDNDYESIFDTPMRVRGLPRLSTPLYSPRASSEPSISHSTTAPSRGNNLISKSTTEPSSSVDSAVIVALTEGRGYAVGEVGLAFINLNRPVLILSQISDCQTYAKTLSKINIFNPAELVVPDTFLSDRNTSAIFRRVTEYFASIKVVSLKRLYFNGEQGLDAVRSLCLPEYSSIDIITLRKYYALAAASALLKYIEHEHNTVYAKQSIQVCYEGAKGVVALDMATSRRLELVKTHGDMVNPEKYSLMGIMDSTVTLGGRRRLRSEILQPPVSKKVIEERLDVVTFLVADPSLLASLQGALVKFSNAEKLMWLCRKTPDFKQEKKTNEMMTNYVLLLKSSLENIPPLRDVLSEAENDFLLNIRDELADQRFEQMRNLISKKIHADAKPTKGYQGSEMNRCFSIKDEVNGLLDVARSTYSKLVQDIQDLITQLADEHNLPLRMSQSAELGFHGQYVLPENSEILSNEIPPIFTDVKIKGNICHVSTDEMFSLNVRVRRAVQEIQLISNVVLYELIKDLRPSVGCLYNLCEKVAALDVLCSLAKYSMTPNFVRPTFGDQLNVQGGRHPVLDHIDPIKPTPNDVVASKNKNLNIVTGPNMSGKTVYLLQIALLQIMAQVGSYVPADSAEFRITDHIYVRKDGSESVENKASSFTVEVKEIIYCLNTMTDTSLIMLDEICTGTNNEGGTAVAWAICEELLCRPAFTFIATHLHFLTNFEKIFVNVTNYHMEAIEVAQPGVTYGPLTYTHRLLRGVTQITHYGLRLMMSTSLPITMKEQAAKIVEALSAKRANCLALAKTIPFDVQSMMSRVDRIEKFMEDLYQLSKSDQYTLESVHRLQRLAVDNIILDEIRSQVLNEPGTPPTNNQDDESVLQSRSDSRKRSEHHGLADIRAEFEQAHTQPSHFLKVPSPTDLALSKSCSSQGQQISQTSPRVLVMEDPGRHYTQSQSQLDSDDLSDGHSEINDIDNEIPANCGSTAQGCLYSLHCPSSSVSTFQGASTSPQYDKSTNSNYSSSSGFDFTYNETTE